MTPAELPMKVPLRVTEFRTLLIRNLVFDTARGLRAPSRTPHTPPRAKPERKKKQGKHVTNRTIRRLKMGRLRCWDKVRVAQGINASTRLSKTVIWKRSIRTTEIHGTGAIAQVITPSPRRYCRTSPRKLICLIIIKKQIVQFIPQFCQRV